MKALYLPLVMIAGCSAAAVAQTARQDRAANVPATDHHAHIGSGKATAALGVMRRYFNEPSPPGDTIARTAEWLISQMDSAGVKHSILLSVAYWFGSPPLQGTSEAANVREENDWVADAVARFPDRIVGFCSVNPLRDYALAEIDRCGANRRISGLKLHLANSGVDLTDTTHVKRVAAAFQAANRHGFPIVLHMWTPAWVAAPTRGSADAAVVLESLLPLAPLVPVQLAHLAGGGSFGEGADRAVSTFIRAIQAKSETVANLYFDISAVVNARQPLWLRWRIAERVREIGIERILYGTDGTRAAEDWAELRELLPLTVDEFAVLQANRLPILKR
jgi:predicted TIM-barrel fold metal-dependent hydrolase